MASNVADEPSHRQQQERSPMADVVSRRSSRRTWTQDRLALGLVAFGWRVRLVLVRTGKGYHDASFVTGAPRLAVDSTAAARSSLDRPGYEQGLIDRSGFLTGRSVRQRRTQRCARCLAIPSCFAPFAIGRRSPITRSPNSIRP